MIGDGGLENRLKICWKSTAAYKIGGFLELGPQSRTSLNKLPERTCRPSSPRQGFHRGVIYSIEILLSDSFTCPLFVVVLEHQLWQFSFKNQQPGLYTVDGQGTPSTAPDSEQAPVWPGRVKLRSDSATWRDLPQ